MADATRHADAELHDQLEPDTVGEVRIVKETGGGVGRPLGDNHIFCSVGRVTVLFPKVEYRIDSAFFLWLCSLYG